MSEDIGYIIIIGGIVVMVLALVALWGGDDE